ncbi:MAG: DUF3108 domain-containing protein [Gammaproteobacteria bacterium]|jgi:hypothetical protein|nr:DUF3108 domain-containing protein [Gammaproteobacteria bacterium]
MRTLLLLAAMLTALPQAADAALPAPLDLRYRLSIGGVTLGAVVKHLTREGDFYRIESRTETSTIGSLLTRDSLTETARFRVVAGSVQPMDYRLIRQGSKSYDRLVEFDYAASVLRFADGRELELPPGTQDSASVLFALMLHPIQIGGEMVMHITDGKHLRRYEYVIEGREVVETEIGAFEAVRLSRHHPQKQLVTTLWLAPRLGNLTVKIETSRPGKPTQQLILENLSGMAAR